MAGYNGWSKSNNAVEAEAGGRYPMTAAKRIVAEAAGVSQAEAARVLRALHRGEWHHASKMYNAVDYYDTAAAVRAVEFACELDLPLDEPYLAAFRAHGLDDEYEWECFREDETDGYGNSREDRRERFAADVESGAWVRK